MTAFEVDCISISFFFRAEDESKANDWLFAFQCSIASKLEQLVEMQGKMKWDETDDVQRNQTESTSQPKMVEKNFFNRKAPSLMLEYSDHAN
jgi:hypothetical protein